MSSRSGGGFTAVTLTCSLQRFYLWLFSIGGVAALEFWAIGGAGVSKYTPLAQFWIYARSLRIADGPDEVHLESVAKMELNKR